MAISPSPYASLLDALRGAHWPARRAVRGAMTGTHHSRMRGVSPEFEEYRAYRQGDDPRRIDWRLLARSDRAYIRLSTDRAVLPTMIVVDASASMDFPRGGESKWALARRIAVGLAAVAHADGDPVGLAIATDSGSRHLPPRTRRGVVAEVARLLDETVPAGAPPLAPTLASARTAMRIALITDFLGDADELLRLAREQGVAGGEMHAVHVVARQELSPDARAVLAADPEDATVRRPLVEETRAGYEAAFGEWRSALAASWRAAGASFAMIAADEPVERAVRRLTTLPAQAREGTARA